MLGLNYRRVALLISSLCIVALLFGWQTESFVEAEDSITFAKRIMDGTAILHPNHLIFEPLYALVVRMFPSLPPLLVAQSFTSMFALAALLSVYLLVSPRSGTGGALIAVWLVMTMYTFWHYAKVVDAYVPALSLALMSLVVFDRLPRVTRPLGVTAMALLMAAAVLVHQLYIFLALLTTIALAKDTRFENEHLRYATLFSTIGILIVGGGYLFVYLADPIEIPFHRWAAGHARNGLWEPPNEKTPFAAVLAIGTTIVSVVPLLAYDCIASFMDSVSGGKMLLEETYVASRVLNPLSAALLVASMGALVISYLVLLGAALRRARLSALSGTQSLLLVAATVYMALVIVWEATNREFWLHPLVFLLIALSQCIRWNRHMALVGVIAVTSGGLVNFWAGIAPLSDRNNDYWWTLSNDILTRVPNDAIVLMDCPWICQQYFAMAEGNIFYSGGGAEQNFDPEKIVSMDLKDVFLVDWAIAPLDTRNKTKVQHRKVFLERMASAFGSLPEPTRSDPFIRPDIWHWEERWQKLP